ncbi:MAG: hypothetical protein NC131_21690 [Roseburia sp.]|nr:hypothetical protein [Roseburia sp.]
MKFTKIIPALFACAAMLVGSSCNEKTEYVPAESAPLEPYYFTTLNNTYRELVDGQTAFQVFMGRADRISSKEVSFEVSTDAPADAFTYPSSVSFKEGQDTVSFFVEFDLTKLEKQKEYKLDFKLAGIQNTPYCYGNMEVTAIYIPWRKFEKKGIYRDGTVSVLFGISDEGIQYDVTIEEHPTTDGLYRIVNPYGVESPFSQFFDVDDETRYLYIHAENPERVYIDACETGIVSEVNGGMLYFESYSNMLLRDGKTEDAIAKDGYYASNVNGIIKYRDAGDNTKETLLAYFEKAPTKQYYANSAGAFKVVLPGYEDEPEAPEWEDLGMFNYTDGFRTPFAGVAEPNTYPVLVQQNVPDPNIFRIVNPYGVASGFVTEEPEENTYMVFDTTNPDCVLMEDYESGLKKGLGFVYFTTWADYYIQEEDATIDEMEMEGFGGTYKDKKIVIPADNCAYKVITASGKLLKAYDCGGTTDACLDMSTPVGEPEAEAAMAKIRANELNMSSVAKKYLRPVKF